MDYSKSFIVPDFGLIKAVSVIEGLFNRATATTENIDGTLDPEKFQKLENNFRIQFKLNPCKRHKFLVRIVLAGETIFIDSNESSYRPESYREV